ncbi:hypothetical protein [Kosakonia sp.]|uniref:hypothetical protein n=1 Tax=Kosakonia sp. TaxID=1916651 RepID=UPI00289CC8B0|nr:hypothetical protein [Kosakonia sp.]
MAVDGIQLLSQGLAALAGLFGGLSVSFFWQPKKLHQHGRLAAGVIIGAISVSTTFTLGGFIARWLGMNFKDSDIAMGIGYFVGAISVGMIAWLANFFNRREGHDILQVAGELKRAARGAKAAPRRRAPRRSKPGESS